MFYQQTKQTFFLAWAEKWFPILDFTRRMRRQKRKVIFYSRFISPFTFFFLGWRSLRLANVAKIFISFRQPCAYKCKVSSFFSQIISHITLLFCVFPFIRRTMLMRQRSTRVETWSVSFKHTEQLCYGMFEKEILKARLIKICQEIRII